MNYFKAKFSKNKGLSVAIFVLIILFSSALRLWQFGQIPEGFQVDEVAFGYNAYSLMQTGRDEFGELLPITLRSFDDYKAAFYSYTAIPFIALFGLNEASVRLPSFVFGIGFIILAFVITFQLSKNKALSFIVMTLCGIAPTLIFLHRAQSDPVVSVFFVALGLSFYLHWAEKKKNILLILGTFSWIISMISYQSPRVFIPLFAIVLFLFLKDKIDKKMSLQAVAMFLILVSFVGYLTFSGGARYKQTSLFTTPDTRLLLEESIRESGIQKVDPTLTRIVHNKVVYFGMGLAGNYLNHLQLKFLFFQTDSPVREVVERTGYLYLFELPFFFFGIIQIFRRRLRWGYFAVGWLLVTPLALSPFIYESPNIHRFLLAFLSLELIVGIGVYEFFFGLKNKKILFNLAIILVPLIFMGSLFYFMYQLFVHQPVHQPWTRNHPYKEMVLEVKKIESEYDKIVMTSSESNTYIFYLFFNQYDPKKYQESGSKGNETYSTLGKYIFVDKLCVTDEKFPGKKVLYVNSDDCVIDPKLEKIKVINWSDNTPEFLILGTK